MAAPALRIHKMPGLKKSFGDPKLVGGVHIMNAPLDAGQRASLEAALSSVTLDDKYTLERGRAYMSGIQALVRLPMLQQERDRAAGLSRHRARAPSASTTAPNSAKAASSNERATSLGRPTIVA